MRRPRRRRSLTGRPEIELTGDAVEVNAMHCRALASRLAVNGETYDLAASVRRRFPRR